MAGPRLTSEIMGTIVWLSVLQRREKIQTAYPQVKITTDLESQSGKWEVYVTGEGTAFYDSCSRMVAALEIRFPLWHP